jgi:hypothetical protein
MAFIVFTFEHWLFWWNESISATTEFADRARLHSAADSSL